MNRPPEARQDGGFTLVELLVAMVLAMVLISVAMSTVVGSQEVVVVSKQQQDINEEARQAINRMGRDIRQASAIVTAVRPNGSPSSAGLVAVRFTADFDGDGCIGDAAPAATPTTVCSPPANDASNPEDISYCFQPGASQLFVIDNAASGVPVASGVPSCSGGQPLLAGNVSDFSVEYRSNLYRYDADADGATSWQELDAAGPPSGNANGLLDVEVAQIDSVVINMTMRLGGRSQVYRTQVDLRNRSA